MKEFSKAYDPQEYEEKIYSKWERSGSFNPDNLDLDDNAENYSIMMPPPNVTGILHLGHALEDTIMDIETRHQRMLGKRVLLLPGTDHAAVATQAKVEKILVSKGIKNPRKDLGREKLLHEIRKYAEESKTTIIGQIKKMGTSCDWSRLAYTFDEKRSLAVNEVFVRMYDDGLIYKGYRVVNWSTKGQSTCSDDELEHEERKTKFYTFRYAKDFPISISTTRPETKLGDTAVAVHPDDKRYQKYIGKTFTVDVGAKKPLNIKVIGDEEVDQDLGTGALGVTPAHSQIDFEMYERNDLDLVQVIGTDGKMTKNAGKEYEGLTVADARGKFVQWLKDQDLLEKEEEIIHNIGKSDRFGDVIEAVPMEQWFVAVNKEIPGKGKTLKNLMRGVVEVGHGENKEETINITPDRFNGQYLHWIDNLRDWCISRQIWWGHRIPIWYCHECDQMFASKTVPEKCARCASESITQEEDTLDTWYSSGLWTFSTLGWPEKTKDLKNYHPTSWMQMGHELLFFWMARMILMTTYALDELPFKKVYIHGILRDKNGQKFSKSLGNGIDPIKMSDSFGTDALRLSLILGTTPGNDSRFHDEKIEEARNMVNKLWNIGRYIFQNNDSLKDERQKQELDIEKLTSADVWILKKMKLLIESVDHDMQNYRFSQAGEKIRKFMWDSFADWYLEVSKYENNAGTKNILLEKIFKDLLRLWHPFVPFVTEALWEQFESNSMLMTSSWPKTKTYDSLLNNVNVDDSCFVLTKKIVFAVRNARADYRINPKNKLEIILCGAGSKKIEETQKEIIKNLKTGIGKITALPKQPNTRNSFATTIDGIDLYIPLKDIIDIAKEKKRLEREINETTKYQQNISEKLENEKFIQNAPEDIIEIEKNKFLQQKEKIEKIKELLKNLE